MPANSKRSMLVIMMKTNPDTSTNSGTSKKNVRVIITDANQYDNLVEVRSFIPDYYENGTCTITFTQDSQTVSKTTLLTKIYPLLSVLILFSRSEFPTAGTWNVTVTYETANAKGVSRPSSRNKAGITMKVYLKLLAVTIFVFGLIALPCSRLPKCLLQ